MDKIVILIDSLCDFKCIVLWSLEFGLEIFCIIRKEDVLFFVWFLDGRILVIFYLSGFVDLVDVRESFKMLM